MKRTTDLLALARSTPSAPERRAAVSAAFRSLKAEDPERAALATAHMGHALSTDDAKARAAIDRIAQIATAPAPRPVRPEPTTLAAAIERGKRFLDVLLSEPPTRHPDPWRDEGFRDFGAEPRRRR